MRVDAPHHAAVESTSFPQPVSSTDTARTTTGPLVHALCDLFQSKATRGHVRKGVDLSEWEIFSKSWYQQTFQVTTGGESKNDIPAPKLLFNLAPLPVEQHRPSRASGPSSPFVVGLRFHHQPHCRYRPPHPHRYPRNQRYSFCNHLPCHHRHNQSRVLRNRLSIPRERLRGRFQTA